MSTNQANPGPQELSSFLLDVLRVPATHDTVALGHINYSSKLVEIKAAMDLIGCPDEGPGAHAFVSFMLRSKLYLKAADGRVLDAPGEVVPLCISSYINDQIATMGNGLTEANPVTLPETVGKNSLDILLLYFQNHIEDETLPDEERHRLDERLLYGMNVIRVCELHTAASSLGIPPLVDICKSAMDRMNASGTALVPPLPPLDKIYPSLTSAMDDDGPLFGHLRVAFQTSRTVTRTSFATASLTGLLNMGGNNSAEHRTRLQTLLQARRKEEESGDKSSSVSPKDKKQEDTRTLDELLSFLGVSEGEGKKGKQSQPSAHEEKKKRKAKGKAKGKERPWDAGTDADSDADAEKDVDVRQELSGFQLTSPQDSFPKDEISQGPSFSSEMDHMERTYSSEISLISNEEAPSTASIFREQPLTPLLLSKSHLPMNYPISGNNLMPIIPARTLPFAGANKPRARLSALPKLEPE